MMDRQLSLQKIEKKNKARREYFQKLESVKQNYGIEFDIKLFNNETIDKIKFYSLGYRNNIKNVTIIYDNKLNKFNYISYDYSAEKDLKGLTNLRIINELSREYKLKLAIGEIQKYNSEYQEELKNIDNSYGNLDSISEKVLEIRKNTKED